MFVVACVLGCSASSSPKSGSSTANGGSGGTSAAGTGGSGTAGTSAGMPGVGGAAAGAPGVGGSAGTPGAGGAPMGGAGGADPCIPIDGGYTTCDVSFDWPETVPGTCLAGRYTGTFNGIYNTFIPVAGNIDFTLTEDSMGEFFEITNGKLAGLANGLIPFSADIEGRLNCTAGKLEMGFLRNGLYDVFGNQTTFEGPVGADYDKLTATFVNGTWNVMEPTPTNGGMGTWTATFTP